MTDIGDFTPQQLAESMTKYNTHVDSIMTTVSENKSALLSLCNNKGFLDKCRDRYRLPSRMSDSDVKEWVRGRLFDSVKPEKRVPQVMPSVLSLYAAQKKNGYHASSSTQTVYIPPVHYLHISDGCLTKCGYMEGETDESDYQWLTPLEYTKLWVHTTSGAYKRKDGNNYSVYAIRIKRPDGSEVELTRKVKGNSSIEGTVKDFSKFAEESNNVSGILGVRSFQSVHVLRALIRVLHDVYGDAVIQKLGILMLDSLFKRNNVSPVYSQVFIPETVLKSEDFKADLSKTWKFIRLPGVFEQDGVADAIYINNDNLIDLKERLGSTGRSEIYWKFNNECFYTELFFHLARCVSDEDDDITERKLCDMVQFLVRPDLRSSK